MGGLQRCCQAAQLDQSVPRGVYGNFGPVGDGPSADEQFATNLLVQMALPPLLAALQGEDSVVVRNAAVALAFFGQPESRPEMLLGLNGSDSYRRWEAVFSLKMVGDAEVVTELIVLLDPATEPEIRVRQEAVLVLSATGDKRVASALLFSLLEDPSPQVRWRAAMGISRLGEPSLLGSLEQAQSTEPDIEVLKWIEGAITKLRVGH